MSKKLTLPEELFFQQQKFTPSLTANGETTYSMTSTNSNLCKFTFYDNPTVTYDMSELEDNITSYQDVATNFPVDRGIYEQKFRKTIENTCRNNEGDSNKTTINTAITNQQITDIENPMLNQPSDVKLWPDGSKDITASTEPRDSYLYNDRTAVTTQRIDRSTLHVYWPREGVYDSNLHPQTDSLPGNRHPFIPDEQPPGN